METDTGPGTARKVVLLIDTSASMRRADLWPACKSKAADILRQTSPGDEVTILTFDRRPLTILSSDEWKAAPIDQRAAIAAEKLEHVKPGWGGTRISEALISAAEALADSAGTNSSGRRQVFLVSDLQEGSHLEALQGYEWPKGIEVFVEIVKAKSPSNAAIQLAGESEDGPAKGRSGIRLRVSNTADSKREQFNLNWSKANGVLVGSALPVYLPPGQSRILSMVAPDSGSADRIVLSGDEDDFDNTVYVMPPEPEKSLVVYLGEDAESNPRQPLYFLRRAFQETRRRSVQVRVRNARNPLTQADADAASLFVLTDSVPEAEAKALRESVAKGKTLLAVITSERMRDSLAALIGVSSIAIQETKPASYALLGQIDFQNPLFTPFADPRYSGFAGIHFWRYRKLDASEIPGSRVVASFDSGDPAVLETDIAKGRLFILASGWHPEDSQLALSTKFVPLLYTLLVEGGAGGTSLPQYLVGDPVPLAAIAGVTDTNWSITLPDGSTASGSPGTNFSTALPGIYTVASGGQQKKFAVNLDPAESRTRPLTADDLEKLGTPMAHTALEPARETARKTRLQNAELENRQKLWRWLIAVTLVVLLIETWLAGRTARTREPSAPEAAS
jgi:hypothetical protein